MQKGSKTTMDITHVANTTKICLNGRQREDVRDVPGMPRASVKGLPKLIINSCQLKHQGNLLSTVAMV